MVLSNWLQLKFETTGSSICVIITNQKKNRTLPAPKKSRTHLVPFVTVLSHQMYKREFALATRKHVRICSTTSTNETRTLFVCSFSCVTYLTWILMWLCSRGITSRKCAYEDTEAAFSEHIAKTIAFKSSRCGLHFWHSI
ncbi:hypothetical protein Plhal304r1_c004g0018161 [Plasmopara halstedii]